MSARQTLLQVFGLLLTLLLFFISVELMGSSFKLMGEGVAEALVRTTSNPFVGLFIGILATSVVQSSSTVTSMTVSIVAGGGLSISSAIPIVMGANIGTSVTNTLVSFGSVTRKEEFRQAMAGATVHDFFNLLAVAVLFPLELVFQVVSRSAAVLTDTLAGLGGTQLLSPLDHLIDPIAGHIIALSGESGPIVLAIGLALLFLSLRFLVKLLRTLFLGRAESMLDRYIFGHPLVAMLFGVGLTFMVQSSTISTSLMVPLVAAGILTVTQIFPFVLGANIGTTLTALVAALVLSTDGGALGLAALTVAFAHLSFNVYGILIFYPIKQMRQIPIWLSKQLGDLAVKNRGYAIGYVGTVFFVIPFLTIMASRGADIDYDTKVPKVLEEAAPAADSSAVSDTTGISERALDVQWPETVERRRPVDLR